MMEEGNGKMEELENQQRQEIYSKSVRAGKRTYFFDVKATRRNDYYLTITESKKRFGRDGKPFYEKHKVFLYKEDFDKFIEGLTETVDYIKEANPQLIEDTDEPTTDREREREPETVMAEDFTDLNFEDLDEGASK
jgi:hypothetical protein